jgi:hypothetical protein
VENRRQRDQRGRDVCLLVPEKAAAGDELSLGQGCGLVEFPADIVGVNPGRRPIRRCEFPLLLLGKARRQLEGGREPLGVVDLPRLCVRVRSERVDQLAGKLEASQVFRLRAQCGDSLVQGIGGGVGCVSQRTQLGGCPG